MKNAALLIVTVLFASPAFAIHVYGDYQCANEKLELKYDGPGSNYAFGGFSNFYTRESKGKVKHLAIEAMDNETKIGEVVADSPLDVIFSEVETVVTKRGKTGLKVGDKCEAGELDYNHSEWQSRRIIEINEISQGASEALGLKKGDKIKVKCNDSMDVPVTCPDSGKYGKDDL
jgi:hypothetical protein